MDDRIHFVEHHGKKILLLDFSHANAHEMQLLLEYVRITVAKHGHEQGSIVTLADCTGCEVDHAVATRIKEVMALDRPFVKKTAWVGAESIPHAFIENFHNFSQRDIVMFKTREEAMDWLVRD